MQINIHTDNAPAMKRANEMVAQRLGRSDGIHTHAAFCDRCDTRGTAHLDEPTARRVDATAGQQRRGAILTLEATGRLIIGIPMNDPKTHCVVHAWLDYAVWLDLMEMGAVNAWFLAYKLKDHSGAPQVRCKRTKALKKGPTNMTIARLITNAKAGQSAFTVDKNPLNLRRENLYLRAGVEEDVRTRASKTHTAALAREADVVRLSLAGRNLGPDWSKAA